MAGLRFVVSCLLLGGVLSMSQSLPILVGLGLSRAQRIYSAADIGAPNTGFNQVPPGECGSATIQESVVQREAP